MIRTAIVGAMAVSLFAGVAPSAQAQGLGSIGRSIFSCGASGNTQAGAAAVGGVLGGLAGAGVARNDALGAILGAAVGAAAGSWIGCRLQGQDQVSLEQATTRALNEDRSTTWSNPQTGASARITVLPDTGGGYGGASTGPTGGGYARYGQPIGYDQIRLGGRVTGAAAYETVAPRYTAVNQTYIRTSPSLRAQTNGSLTRGEQFEALAKVSGQPWILVGRNGRGVGYVPENAVRAEADYAAGGGYGGGYAQPISRQQIRLGTGVSWANAYESAAPLYSVRSNANLRATPSLQGRSLGQLYRGDEVEAIAKVQGQPWILVGRNGSGIGYMHESVLDPLQSAPDYAANNRYPGAGGYPTASANCRIVEQAITTRESAAQTQRYRACRDSSGNWTLAAV
jgi:uncharacterized protein YgiM (DUF1202 family)